ncbi:putative inorganic phosphate cotransporter isoform X2 [Condylostylus longicornis]|nr:putative inorganic phosphate cotransporter isoform X2 [Condylostylus longicornis]XP_055381834.1 putative inorganic phosphate cotransporter isoform X2 [Condylostylus longicornis]XP_055381835.1 putative inorganic phosphate cotransporter isoform X2 [Condylostylus longicornis]
MTSKNDTNPDFEEYKWDEKTKSLLLSSFFWGYVVTQVPGGYLSQKYGSRPMLFFGVLICSLLAILTPICASLGDWQFVCALRVAQGFCQGVVFPSTHNLLSKWAPVEERGKLGTWCYAGAQFGTVIMLASSGIIASSRLGWPSIFYISGSTGIIWSIFWFIYGSSTPAQHKTISDDERKFIETSLGKFDDQRTKNLNIPWFKILTSMPFVALIIVHCAHNWGFWTLLTEMPTYMKNILNLDIKSNALFSSLPYLAMCLLSFMFTFLSDILSRKTLMSLSFSRKFFNTIGHWIPMVSLIALAYVDKNDQNLAIILLTITVGINAATYLGFQVNHIDLSPNFAGTLMGITNCAANIMSIIAPLTVGLVVSDEKNPAQWKIVFFISAGIYLIGNLLFIIFGKTEEQAWNNTAHGQLTPKVRRTSIIVEAVESHN